MTTVRFEGKPLDEKTLRGVHNYFNIYMLLLTLSVLLLSLDGFDLVTTFTSVATCLNNVGPGLEMVGPAMVLIFALRISSIVVLLSCAVRTWFLFPV